MQPTAEPSSQSGNPRPKLRWYQYSLRTLFLVMTLFASACSWYGYEMNEAAKRRAAIENIVEAGGFVEYCTDHPLTRGRPPRWFSWMRKLHGDEYLGNAVGVFFDTDEESNAERPRITDAQLVNLEGLKNLEIVLIVEPQITDAGLVHLRDLTNLKELWLISNRISDAGLVNLKGLTNLEVLKISAEEITDAGMEHLERLPKLRYLSLTWTKVTIDGVCDLREALPDCNISHSPPPLTE